MPDPPDIGREGRATIAIGWLLLIPIAMLWLQYRQGIASGSYADSPSKSVFAFVPMVFLIGLSFLLYLKVLKTQPNNRSGGSFFWIACAPIVAEFIVSVLA
ncbi:MAG: hypothetical protein KDA37_13035 [Planctomycetales bacterium]|nr:hypothetical protein [Planctomycetales bacterium]